MYGYSVFNIKKKKRTISFYFLKLNNIYKLFLGCLHAWCETEAHLLIFAKNLQIFSWKFFG